MPREHAIPFAMAGELFMKMDENIEWLNKKHKRVIDQQKKYMRILLHAVRAYKRTSGIRFSTHAVLPQHLRN